MNKLIVGLVVLLALFGLHSLDKHYAVKEAVATTTATMNKEYQKKLDAANQLARQKQDSMQAQADQSREEKDAQINSINRKLDAALISLRNRPYRPTTPINPQDTSPVEACTARELYREDAEFLTREAARAETVVAERNYYYTEYEKVRKQINGLAK